MSSLEGGVSDNVIVVVLLATGAVLDTMGGVKFELLVLMA
jgi:hypothetical protein